VCGKLPEVISVVVGGAQGSCVYWGRGREEGRREENSDIFSGSFLF
jgi:hypothetical protein